MSRNLILAKISKNKIYISEMWKLVNSGGVVKQKFYQKEMCDSEGGSTLLVKAEQIWRLF